MISDKWISPKKRSERCQACHRLSILVAKWHEPSDLCTPHKNIWPIKVLKWLEMSKRQWYFDGGRVQQLLGRVRLVSQILRETARARRWIRSTSVQLLCSAKHTQSSGPSLVDSQCIAPHSSRLVPWVLLKYLFCFEKSSSTQFWFLTLADFHLHLFVFWKIIAHASRNWWQVVVVVPNFLPPKLPTC